MKKFFLFAALLFSAAAVFAQMPAPNQLPNDPPDILHQAQ